MELSPFSGLQSLGGGDLGVAESGPPVIWPIWRAKEDLAGASGRAPSTWCRLAGSEFVQLISAMRR